MEDWVAEVARHSGWLRFDSQSLPLQSLLCKGDNCPYESTNGDVIVADDLGFRRKIRAISNFDDLKNSLFLDIAQFIDDRVLEINASRQAIINLANISMEVAEGWLARAELSEAARQAAEELLGRMAPASFVNEDISKRSRERNNTDFSIFRDLDKSGNYPEMIILPNSPLTKSALVDSV